MQDQQEHDPLQGPGSTAEVSWRRGEEVGKHSVKMDQKKKKKREKNDNTFEYTCYIRETFVFENKLTTQVGGTD